MIEVRVNDGMAKRFESAMRQAPQLLQPFLLDGMRRVGLGIEAHVKANALAGQGLQARTGTLRRAVFSRVEATGAGDAVAIVGVDLAKAPYGRAHEMGGTIRPKRSAMLAIPLGEARTGKGVTRFSARDLMSNPGAFGYTGAFVRNNVIYGTKNRKATPLFALKPSVTVRAVGYLKGSVEEKRTWAIEELGRALTKGLKKVFPGA